MKKKVLFIFIFIIILFISYYLFLPAINPLSIGFWLYLMFLYIIFIVLYSIFNANDIILTTFRHPSRTFKTASINVFVIFGIIALILVIDFILSPVFFAKNYSKRINVSDGDFAKDMLEVDFNKVPLLDRDSSEKLGDRTMGAIPEYVSQYYVSDSYTQINYNDEILRVTPLEYDGFIKWLTNKDRGIPGYISVNSVNGDSKLVKLNNSIQYAKSAYFHKDLKRHLRFKYPFTIFGEESFEIDNDGNPYYIIPTLSYGGISIKEKVTGCVILDPISGDTKYYDLENIPSYVDHVYPSSLVLEEVNDWGRYKDGFLNSIFGQKNVVKTTDGYNYLALNDDIYLYTGITSVLSDESNLGFILTNLRTSETVYYDVAGAEEYSAMDSAKGQVQQMNYESTFPLLINLNNRPTYLVSLKDKAGLVKMYGFIDVVDYQKVVVSEASLGINEVAKRYLKAYSNVSDSNLSKDIIIKDIKDVTIDGNTYYYILSEDDKKYKVALQKADILPFVKIGDKLKISYVTEEDITEITKVGM